MEMNSEQSFSSENNSDREEYRKIKNEGKIVKKKKNLGQVLDGLLKKKSKREDQILVGCKSAFKKIDEEKKKVDEIREKKIKKMEQKKLGYKPVREWDKVHDKNLVKITTKGVVKLFNSIFDFRKKIRNEKEKEEIAKERKSTNFLMMHNLDPNIGKNKAYKEDIDN